jgi:signal peptidase II
VANVEGNGASADATPLRVPETRERWLRVIAAVAAIVGADQLTKVWAVSALAHGPKNLIGDTVKLELSRNSGAAFSRFQGYTPVLAVLAIAIAFLIARATRDASDRWVLFGLVLVLGGALGNLGDRLVRSPGFLRGHVVDFIAVGWWPVFNVADSCVTVGAVVLVVRTLFAPSAAPTGSP